jgi:predicted metalloprotease with PDZ domain
MIRITILIAALITMTQSQFSTEYTLSMSSPSTHLFEAGMRISSLTGATIDLHMPAWRTGRYLIQDFSGAVQEFSAADERGRLLQWKKTDKDTWRIERGSAKSVSVSYKVFANEFNQRTRELNADHAFLDPSSVFMYVNELKNTPLRLTVTPYGNWHVTTGLDPVEGMPHTFTAPNFEYFADCPLEIGLQKDFEFFVDGKQHIISIYGDGNWNSDTLISDFAKIVNENKKFWGDLPYSRYLFLIHCQPNAGGGTEHINSTIMGVRPFIFSDPNAYKGFLGLVSHEYFHTWNVKQLRPKAFAPYDFSRENYSEELWISEGATSYFDDLINLRAGFGSADQYLGIVSRMISDDRSRHGNTIQTLAEASYDAWVKYWRRRPNARNAEADYYGKGQHVSLLLDLTIRHRSGGKASLDDVMRAMYRKYPLTKGFTNADFIAMGEKFAGSSLSDFFSRYLYGTTPLDWEGILSYAGLIVIAKEPAARNGIGITTQDSGEKTRVTALLPGSPAERSGIELNDEIVALNGYRIRSTELSDRIASMSAGEKAELTVFRNDKLKTIAAVLEPMSTHGYIVKKSPESTPLQKSIFEQWLGESF